MPTVAPKDEIAHKTLLLNATTQGLFSKTTFYDEWGFDSPEDTLAMLTEENANPLLNPDTTSKILNQANSQLPPTPGMPGMSGQQPALAAPGGSYGSPPGQ